jgi:hypothetical protein
MTSNSLESACIYHTNQATGQTYWLDQRKKGENLLLLISAMVAEINRRTAIK